MKVFPRYVEPGTFDKCKMSVDLTTPTYRYYVPESGGKYGDIYFIIRGYLLIISEEPGFSLEFDDPSVLMQGDYTISKRGTIERDVTHVCYRNANIVVPPTMGDTNVPMLNGPDGPLLFTVYERELLPSDDQFHAFGGPIFSTKFGVDDKCTYTAQLGIVRQWDRRYWAWLNRVAVCVNMSDPDNNQYWTNVVTAQYAWYGGGAVPYSYRPSDSYIREIEERFTTPLRNFGALISRALDGDNFSLVDEGSASNDALQQLTASQASSVNWIENAMDISDLFKSVKKANLKRLKKTIKKRAKRLRGAANKSKLTQTARLFESTPLLAPNGKESFNHRMLYAELSESIRHLGFSSEEADTIIASGCLQGYSDRKAKRGLALLRGRDVTVQQTLNGVADAWLFKRYAVDTTMLDLNELSSGSYGQLIDETLALTSKFWQHVHATDAAHVIQADGTVHLTGKHSFSTWAQPNITNSVQEAVVNNQAFGAVTLANLWDIVPFSFIADWFFHTGDFLEKLDAKIGIDAAHYEFDVGIDSYSFDKPSDVGLMHCYVRKVTQGNRSISLDSKDSYDPSTKTWLRRLGDSVALLQKAR